MVRLHVAPKGAAGQRPTLDVRVRLPARQRRVDVLGGVVDDDVPLSPLLNPLEGPTM